MELIYFTLLAVILYFVADRILQSVEQWRGRRFEQRSVIFLFILFALASGSFYLIRLWLT